MKNSGIGKFSLFASIVTVSLIQGCNNEPTPTPPPASTVTQAPVAASDPAKVQKASGPGSNAATDTTIIGTGKK